MRSPVRGRGAHRDRDRGRLSGRCRDESGSILVLFSIFLTLFLLCCAIVVDVGYWWAAAKRAQIAADACALAAARELPQAWNAPPRSECYIGGRDYALANLPDQSGTDPEPLHLSTTVLSPYEGQSSMVEATVEMRVQTFFGRIVGLEWIDLTRRAVAERQEGEGNYAIYSHSPFCPQDGTGESLIFNGEDMNINGRVHSNGQFLINNADFWALIGTQVFCDASINPHGSARFFGPSYEESVETEPRPVSDYNPDGILDYENWPEWFVPGDFPCTVSGTKIEIDSTLVKVNGSQFGPPHGGTIPTGTYCATELFKIGGDNLKGEITALAPKIEVSGNNNDFTYHAGNHVLFFALPNIIPGMDGAPDGTGPLTCSVPGGSPVFEMNLVNGNNSLWKGKIFHPCGRIIVDGNSTSTIEGAIYGFQVKVNGNGFNMLGKSDTVGDAALALVE